MKVTVDTNVLVRLATQDDPAQADIALQVLREAASIAVLTVTLCEMVWVLLRGYRYSPVQAAHAVRTLTQVGPVVCDRPAVQAGLALLEAGGDFAGGVIAFEGERLGGEEFVSFDQRAVKLLKTRDRKARCLT